MFLLSIQSSNCPTTGNVLIADESRNIFQLNSGLLVTIRRKAEFQGCNSWQSSVAGLLQFYDVKLLLLETDLAAYTDEQSLWF